MRGGVRLLPQLRLLLHLARPLPLLQLGLDLALEQLLLHCGVRRRQRALCAVVPERHHGLRLAAG